MLHGHGLGSDSLHVRHDNRCTHHAGQITAQTQVVVAEAIL